MKAGPLLKNYASLLNNLYGSVLDDGGLSNFSAELGTLLHCHSASIFIANRAGGQVKTFASSWNLDESSLLQYQNYYSTKDLVLQKAYTMPIGKFYASTLYPIEDQRQYKRSEVYQDYNRLLDIHQITGAFIPVDDSHLMMVAFYRNKSVNEFCQAEMELLDTLIPHFSRYLKIQTRLQSIEQKCDNIAGAIDHFSLPFLLINNAGKVVFISQSARAKIAREPHITLSQDKLRFRQPTANQRLQHLISSSLSRSVSCMEKNSSFWLRCSGRSPMSILVTPVIRQESRFDFLNDHIKCIVFFHDPEDQIELNKTILANLYGISPAEAWVAIHLAAGKSLEEITALSGNSVNTTRTQVKSLMRKTQTSRQAELVSVLLTSLARVTG